LSLVLGSFVAPRIESARWARPAFWTLSACTAIALFLALEVFFPAYSNKFGVRAGVQCFADDPARVLCYPHRWDSVAFYLRRGDVAVFEPNQRQRLTAELASRERTIVFVKSG